MGRNIVTRRVMVGTEVVRIIGENPKRKSFIIQNKGTASIYLLGSENLTKDDGIEVAAGATFSDETSTGAIYAVAESGTQDVRVMVIGD